MNPSEIKELSVRVAMLEALQTILLCQEKGTESQARALLEAVQSRMHAPACESLSPTERESAQRWEFVANMRTFMLDRHLNDPHEIWNILERFDRKA